MAHARDGRVVQPPQLRKWGPCPKSVSIAYCSLSTKHRPICSFRIQIWIALQINCFCTGRRSLGAECNWGIRFRGQEDAEQFLVRVLPQSPCLTIRACVITTCLVESNFFRIYAHDLLIKDLSLFLISVGTYGSSR